MRRNRIKVGVPAAMAILILIAVALLAVSSARSDGATAGTLSNSEMSKIIGMCGCHTEVSQRGCTEGDDPSPECGGPCQAYNLAGANPNYCASKPPENDWTCESEDDVICKTPYSCSSESKWMLNCKGTSCTGGFIHTWCQKCTCTAGEPNKLSSHYCDT